MAHEQTQKAEVDLRTGEIVFLDSGFRLYRGLLSTAIQNQFGGAVFRDFDEIDYVTGLRTTDPSWDPGKTGFLDFTNKIDINGNLFIMTADIADHVVNFIAMKACVRLSDNRLGSDWGSERKVREVHREWLEKNLDASKKKSENAWGYEWGSIIDYFDEIQWGASIWISQNR